MNIGIAAQKFGIGWSKVAQPHQLALCTYFAHTFIYIYICTVIKKG